ncbi:MAG: COX15/CtaA family protein [Alphaproteobacteria bacterium]|nr:COX15/CtaA family protein [Alphaproteobacteria bacterium]
MDTPLYHFGLTAQLLLLGALVAVLPLAWVAWRFRGQGNRTLMARLTWVTLFLTFDLVLFGAFTRLSDSGLGCPDWPGCYGQATPVGAKQQIQAAQDLMPTGPVTHGKAWVEMVHRYLATGVGALILVLCLMAWRGRWRVEPQAGAWGATLTLLWVCMQGAFGALTVTMKLFPAIVTLHLLGGLGLLALLAWQAAQRQAQLNPRPALLQKTADLRPWLRMGLLILIVQIALGGWVSTNYAVLVCDTFPQCQGTMWPQMDFTQGFELWRPLGHTAKGDLLTFQALTAIHYTHRLAAYLVVAALALLAWCMHRRGLSGLARALAALVALQFLTGLSNVVLGWPMLAAVSHTGGAAAMVIVLVLAVQRTQPQFLNRHIA